MARLSIHREPVGPMETARHYLGDLIYGANDGIITTFAVVAGVEGGALSASAVLIVGVANLLADGLSMGAGNYLSIRSREGARAAQGLLDSPTRLRACERLGFSALGFDRVRRVARTLADLEGEARRGLFPGSPSVPDREGCGV
jgi:hypothetical protein